MSLNPDQFGGSEFGDAKPGPGQLKMFMTPMEISKGFQPNPRDRMLKGEHPSAAYDRAENNRPVPAGAEWESERDLNVRKFRENKTMYPQNFNREKTGPDLNEWVKEKRQIPGVLHLAQKPGYDTTNSPYDPSRGVVAGGHHRLAAARAADPGMLLPVVHHETMQAAYSRETPEQWRDRGY